MPQRFKILIACIVLSIFLGTNPATAQILRDSNSTNLIKKNIDCIYNMQFKEANEIYLKFKKIYPGYPGLYLLRGLTTYWQNYPLLYTNPAHVSFEEDLRQCIRLSEKSDNAAYNAEYLLINLCARGMLLRFYDNNNHIMEIIPLVTSTYKYLRRSFHFTSVCQDLFYYTGVYNFYREAYPEVHPVYIPVSLLLPGGSKETGLKELHIAAKNAIMLRGESYYLLASIYLNFENKYSKSIEYCKSLYSIYPENELYLSMYIKNLLLLKQYDKAEQLITLSQKESDNKFFQGQLSIFEGVVQEKKYRDNNLAQQYYQSGINKISLFGEYSKEYVAYAYFGLSRISELKKDTNTGKKFRQLAMKMGDFKKVDFDN
ncbi:MAG: hypothetical protein PHT07_16990 [Paludibacter sp.]|nr:hypothetical protein [Paludibacter sp.]